MKTVWRNLVWFVLGSGGLLLAACGGGGGGGTPAPTATVTGIVSGTEVVAFDQNNNLVDSDVADSGGNFSLSLPTGRDYRIYLLENDGTANERLYPLYQGSSNVFTISSAVTVDLGLVGTATGVAVPTNDPLAVTGVSDGGSNTAIPLSLAGEAYDLTDLQGSWSAHALISGDAGATPAELPGWLRGTLTFAADGAGTWSGLASSPARTDPADDTFAITPAGVVTRSGDSSFQGIMSIDGNLIVATADDPDGGYQLLLLQQTATSYLAGEDFPDTWAVQALVSGDATADTPGWLYGVQTISTAGVADWTTDPTRSNGVAALPAGETLTLTAGTVTSTTSGTTGYHGTLSPDKELLVATATDNDTSLGGATLQFYQKRTGGTGTSPTYALADLDGTWTVHRLVSGDDPQAPAWGRGVATISGGALGWAHFLRSDGSSTLPADDTLSIAAGSGTTAGTGVVTGSGGFHGVLSRDKRTLIATTTATATVTDPTSGYVLWIFQK